MKGDTRGGGGLRGGAEMTMIKLWRLDFKGEEERPLI